MRDPIVRLSLLFEMIKGTINRIYYYRQCIGVNKNFASELTF